MAVYRGKKKASKRLGKYQNLAGKVRHSIIIDKYGIMLQGLKSRLNGLDNYGRTKTVQATTDCGFTEKGVKDFKILADTYKNANE